MGRRTRVEKKESEEGEKNWIGERARLRDFTLFYFSKPGCTAPRVLNPLFLLPKFMNVSMFLSFLSESVSS